MIAEEGPCDRKGSIPRKPVAGVEMKEYSNLSVTYVKVDDSSLSHDSYTSKPINGLGTNTSRLSKYLQI